MKAINLATKSESVKQITRILSEHASIAGIAPPVSVLLIVEATPTRLNLNGYCLRRSLWPTKFACDVANDDDYGNDIQCN